MGLVQLGLIHLQETVEDLRLEKVADLIDNGRWNVELIQEAFSPLTAHKILAIPLANQGNVDSIYWFDSTNGIYVCKSGYNFIRSLVAREEASTSSGPLLQAKLWRRLWASPALPRCKEVAWRAVRNFLPMRGELVKRGMQLDPCCPFCETEVETCGHLFLKCPAVERVWFASDLAIRTESFSSVHALMVAVLEEDDVDFIAAVQQLMYVTWEARNSMVFNGRKLDVGDVLRRSSMLKPWDDGIHIPQSLTASRPANWKRPEEGIVKINFDASVKNEIGGLGMVARGTHGAILGAAALYPVSVISPLLGEACGFRWALKLATEFGFRSVCFETDYLQLFEWWKKGSIGLSYLDTIVRECRLFTSAFSYFQFTFVRRSGNLVADFLARNASNFPNSVWVEEVPHDVDHLVINDALASSPALI
ncbi:uncharacterized protein LOC130744833 [Lotus japonicus]|uniref:uncharacterized protein LOC130744833 n=1 Tax=Lotus japonicus TaxID=34305 RepID=UPI002586B7F3|nr:uncharacterized protein LOC130744833 [Lotus japonicus]